MGEINREQESDKVAMPLSNVEINRNRTLGNEIISKSYDSYNERAGADREWVKEEIKKEGGIHGWLEAYTLSENPSSSELEEIGSNSESVTLKGDVDEVMKEAKKLVEHEFSLGVTHLTVLLAHDEASKRKVIEVAKKVLEPFPENGGK